MKRITNFFGSLLLIELLRGMMLTGRHLFARKITVQFPEEKTPQSPRFRGLHALRRYPFGVVCCFVCLLCVVVCLVLVFFFVLVVLFVGLWRTTRYDFVLFLCF